MNAVTRPAALAPDRLRITEIFLSLQGESTLAGWPTAFIRLTGCPLRCQYCDTAYAFTGGEAMAVEDVLSRTRAYGVRHVCVTGGEPLAQRSCIELLRRLCDEGFTVSLETSGAMDVSDVDPRVIKVLDIKTPGSGESHRNCWDNLGKLGPADQIKFVICGRPDYEWARAEVGHRDLAKAYTVLFSPSYAQVSARELADWIVEDRLPVRFQIQLHKMLWGTEPGR